MRMSRKTNTAWDEGDKWSNAVIQVWKLRDYVHSARWYRQHVEMQERVKIWYSYTPVYLLIRITWCTIAWWLKSRVYWNWKHVPWQRNSCKKDVKANIWYRRESHESIACWGWLLLLVAPFVWSPFQSKDCVRMERDCKSHWCSDHDQSIFYLMQQHIKRAWEINEREHKDW